MTKAELIDSMRDYPDDTLVVIEVHDTSLHEDLYDFYVDPISWSRIDGNQMKHMSEIRLSAVNHHEKQMT